MRARNYIEIMADYTGKVPMHVIEDVFKRCSDWVASGGKESDPYIQNQLKYLRDVADSESNKGIDNTPMY